MGLKAIEEHYNISHLIQRRGDNICIGSTYISEIMVINQDGMIIKGREPQRANADLNRIITEMMIDEASGKLKELVQCEDSFENVTPVYTFRNGKVLKQFCEVEGWPNITTTGEMMYENTHFKTYAEAKKACKIDSKAGVKSYWRTFRQMLREQYKRFMLVTGHLCCECYYLIRSYLNYQRNGRK
jgi:hypothetical protein